MAYSTGSGDYNALMAAVLAFAIADGWVEAGGIGTGWPISKGECRGVDWDTFTVSDTDYTSGTGVPHTTRWIRIAVGSTPTNATANLGNDAAHFPNMEYTIDAWHIFSDPTVSDHINVVVQFSNGIDAQVFGHFSFGAINKHGMTHNGVAYASGHPVRGFSPDVRHHRNNSNDAASGVYARIKRIFTGQLGYNYTFFNTYNNTCLMTDAAASPFPIAATWPADDVMFTATRMLDVYGPSHSHFQPHQTPLGGVSPRMSAFHMFVQSQLYSGGVSLGPLPLFLANTTSNSTTLRFINPGSFPNVRTCSLENLLPGDEITFAGDTWKVFPVLCQKARSTLGQQYTVTSGQHGFAYKKVI